MGCRVLLTEESPWLGGQLTSQAVPPDEHRWIERFGCTVRYRRLRDTIRAVYRERPSLSDRARSDPFLNPGRGSVSALCCEPKTALEAIARMLQPTVNSKLLEIVTDVEPLAAETERDRVRAVRLRSRKNGEIFSVEATFFLDATETGELLPLTDCEHVEGAESSAETGELHAPLTANPANLQAITWCLAIAHDPESHRIGERPAQYAFWRDYVPNLSPAWPGKLLAWEYSDPVTLQPKRPVLFEHETVEGAFPIWKYRRIVCSDTFRGPSRPNEVTIVNWPHNDFLLGSVIGVSKEEREALLDGARQLSLSLLYWLQTEAPRADGGAGYSGLYAAPDITGREDGLALRPYIRESRRIRARFTVKEEHIGAEMRRAAGQQTAARFPDSVGIGSYRIDLHPSTGGDNYIDVESLPFQIPLGALVPVRLCNLLPACKNLGTTHVTNGCYRLHPVEWTIGEAAGALAAFCKRHSIDPAEVVEKPLLLVEFQQTLRGQGFELEWPQSVVPR